MFGHPDLASVGCSETRMRALEDDLWDEEASAEPNFFGKS